MPRKPRINSTRSLSPREHAWLCEYLRFENLEDVAESDDWRSVPIAALERITRRLLRIGYLEEAWLEEYLNHGFLARELRDWCRSWNLNPGRTKETAIERLIKHDQDGVEERIVDLWILKCTPKGAKIAEAPFESPISELATTASAKPDVAHSDVASQFRQIELDLTPPPDSDLLKTKSEIDAALRIMDPRAAHASVKYAQFLAQMTGRRIPRHQLEQAVVISTGSALEEAADRRTEHTEVLFFLMAWGKQIVLVGHSIDGWIALNEKRLQSAVGWAKRAALIGLGAAFGVWLG